MFRSSLKFSHSLVAPVLLAALCCGWPGFAQAPAADQSVSVLAKFDGTIDTKSAKAGDAVAAKVKKDVKTKELTIPKGSRILGSVLSVTSMQEGNGTAALAIRLDRLEMKGGQTIPIKGLIQGIGSEFADPGMGVSTEVNRGALSPSAKQAQQAAPVGHDDTGMANGSSLEGVAIGLGLNPDGAACIAISSWTRA